MGSLSLASLRFLQLSIRASLGAHVASSWLLLIAAQFHTLFYCSRTLPNTFALICVNVAAGMLLNDRPIAAVCVHGPE